MPDSLGPIVIPEPSKIDPFPFQYDYGSAVEMPQSIVVHLFDQPGLKTEQRFIQGDRPRRWRLRIPELYCDDYEQLRDHWEAARGPYAYFDFSYPKPGGGYETVEVRYESPTISWQHLSGLRTGDPGIVLVEYLGSDSGRNYSGTIVDRFPSSGLNTSLLAQEQRFHSLVKVTPKDAGAVYLASTRLTFNGQLYLGRLLDWSGISQTLGENSDTASFSFGDADSVFRKFSNAVNLRRAKVEFALLHANTSTRIDMWAGYTVRFGFDRQGIFTLDCSDAVIELNLAYPTRRVSRFCWKEYKGRFCLAASGLATCSKSWADCVERNNTPRFGGVKIEQEDARPRDPVLGGFAHKRSGFSSVTVSNESVYDRVLQEVYTDTAMPVVCDVIAGKDENEFYSALGIVGEGPISAYNTDLGKHLLDNQMPHDPLLGGGWRYSLGNDPADNWFALSHAPYYGPIAPPEATFAAGTAWAEIRRTDERGLQLSKVSDRTMTVSVTGGMGGWVWSGPGARTWRTSLVNPIWIAVNCYLKALGYKADPTHASDVSAAEMESFFDVQSAIDAAAICDTMVTPMPGLGTTPEVQFTFKGVFREQKPLRDWIQEILNSCLGYYTFRNGKLYLGIRINSSVAFLGAFTRANILYGSLGIEVPEPSFNHLTIQFGDIEYDWQLNNSQTYDIDHAKAIGNAVAPRFLASSMNLVGVSTKSQASRLAVTRLREELGGYNLAQQFSARAISFRTTVLAMGLQVGQVVSLDHADLPGGRVEGRIVRWTLNSDYSLDISTSCTTNQMYDMAIGPKPEDEHAPPVPAEQFPSAKGLAWMPNEVVAEPDDPIYTQDENTFSLYQSYTLETEGTYSPLVHVAGEMTINQFLLEEPCIIRGIRYQTSGGNLAGGRTWYFQVCQQNVAGQPGPMSNIAAVWIPTGSNTNSVVLERLISRSTLPGWSLFVGTDPRRLSQQVDARSTALPSTYTFSASWLAFGRGVPNYYARKVRVKAKEVEHSGVAGLQIFDVLPPNQIYVPEFIGSDDAWVGQLVSVVADASDMSVPLWNFTITGFDAAEGIMTLSPDCVRGTPEDSVQPNDVMIVRARPTAATASTITNTLWQNDIARWQHAEAADGLIPNAEIGLVIRIIAGKGAGQRRTIVSNTNIMHVVDRDWDVVPDATSVYIVEYPDWVYQTESSVFQCDQPDSTIELDLHVDNLQGLVALVGGFLVDEQEYETAEEAAVFREIFLFGQPYDVRTVKDAPPEEWFTTDQTVRIDTDEKDEVYTLPPLLTVRGRALLIINDGDHEARVRMQEGETFYDGSTEILLAHKGDMIRVTAAGEKYATPMAGRAAGGVWNRWGRNRHHRTRIYRRWPPPHSRKSRRTPIDPRLGS